MPRYSEELRNSTIKKMMPPNNRSITELSREIGVPEGTLHNWRKQARLKGYATPGDGKEADAKSFDGACERFGAGEKRRAGRDDVIAERARRVEDEAQAIFLASVFCRPDQRERARLAAAYEAWRALQRARPLSPFGPAEAF